MKKKVTVYQQKEKPFAKHKYRTSTLGEAGCGVLATINAINYLNGNLIDYKKLASWAGKTHYVHNVGSEHTISKDASYVFGKEYQFKCTEYYVFKNTVGNLYPKSSEDFDLIWNKLISKLKNGEVAVGLVHGHFIAIVDYDSKTKKVLVLDSAAHTSRNTTILGDWKSKKELDYNSSEGSPKLKLRSSLTFLAKI